MKKYLVPLVLAIVIGSVIGLPRKKVALPFEVPSWYSMLVLDNDRDGVATEATHALSFNKDYRCFTLLPKAGAFNVSALELIGTDGLTVQKRLDALQKLSKKASRQYCSPASFRTIQLQASAKKIKLVALDKRKKVVMTKTFSSDPHDTLIAFLNLKSNPKLKTLYSIESKMAASPRARFDFALVPVTLVDTVGVDSKNVRNTSRCKMPLANLRQTRGRVPTRNAIIQTVLR